jgi:negative regulator of genetic competence, sporulation and motility
MEVAVDSRSARGYQMKIERVDHKTVKCFLSNEELQTYDITYKDFITRSEKAREVMEEIIIQAEEKVGYQPPKFSFDLQIMMMPEKGMVLTFSEKDPGENQADELLAQCFQELRQLFENKLGINGQTKQLPQVSDGEETRDAETAVRDIPEFAVFSFSSLRYLYEYAAILPEKLNAKTKLYKRGDQYYLYLSKGKASAAQYGKACIEALEFASLYTADGVHLSELEEHADCLLPRQVIEHLTEQ